MNEEPGINIENLGDVRWHLCLCLVLAWTFVILFVSRGIQSTGKVRNRRRRCDMQPSARAAHLYCSA